MPVTTNLALDVPAHGSNVDTWDTSPINNNSQLLDSVFGSVTSITPAGATTLTTTQLDVAILRITIGTANCTVNVGAIRKAWVIENLSTSTGLALLTGGSGNVIALPPGSCQAYWDGTNMAFLNMQQVGDYKQTTYTATPAWVSACTVPPYLPCTGGTFAGATYPILAAILGTTQLPDKRGRAHYDIDGGTGRLTAANSGVNGTTLFAAGGSPNFSATLANLPNTTLSINLTNLTTRLGAINGSIPGNAQGGTGVSTYAAASFATLANITGSVGVNGGQTQQAGTTLSPALVGGITMIRAG